MQNFTLCLETRILINYSKLPFKIICILWIIFFVFFKFCFGFFQFCSVTFHFHFRRFDRGGCLTNVRLQLHQLLLKCIWFSSSIVKLTNTYGFIPSKKRIFLDLRGYFGYPTLKSWRIGPFVIYCIPFLGCFQSFCTFFVFFS